MDATAPGDSTPASIAALRREYRADTLSRADLAPSPMAQFRRWFDEAAAAGIREPNAMTLATAGLDGLPSARTVLMKECGEDGITFFSSYTSRKGREIEAAPVAAALFFWKEIERQVQLRGSVERTPRETSEEYFRGRPYDSRVGAWASRQSEEIPDRRWLEQRFAESAAAHPDDGTPACVPLPDNWGGFRIRPVEIEFWQGRPGRLHDRFRYRLVGEDWTLERLSP